MLESFREYFQNSVEGFSPVEGIFFSVFFNSSEVNQVILIKFWDSTLNSIIFW